MSEKYLLALILIVPSFLFWLFIYWMVLDERSRSYQIRQDEKRRQLK